MTESEALEKSIVLWTALISEFSKMDPSELRELEEHDLNELKHKLDPDTDDCTWSCFMCEFFYDAELDRVDCASCCISNDCGTCNEDYGNAFEEITFAGNTRINKLRAANRILQSMKARLLKLQTEKEQDAQQI